MALRLWSSAKECVRERNKEFTDAAMPTFISIKFNLNLFFLSVALIVTVNIDNYSIGVWGFFYSEGRHTRNFWLTKIHHFEQHFFFAFKWKLWEVVHMVC